MNYPSFVMRWFLLILVGALAGCGTPRVAKLINTPIVPADETKAVSRSFGGERRNFMVDGCNAFMILPKNNSAFTKGKRPWIWFAPTLVKNYPGPELEWLFPRLLQAGFAIAGIDVGESYGNPVGRAQFTRFHSRIVKEFGLSSKACLLPQSRGGLMLYNWAAEHPKNVRCIGGIYTVCDLASYPGLEKAAPAYGMSRDELAECLSENNPIDRLAPLAQAKIPILHIHGNADKIVPLEKNSGELIPRYQALGGNGQLIIVPGKGHEIAPEFFQSQALLDFFLSNGGGGGGF